MKPLLAFLTSKIMFVCGKKVYEVVQLVMFYLHMRNVCRIVGSKTLYFGLTIVQLKIRTELCSLL